jgi:hypothetical protein
MRHWLVLLIIVLLASGAWARDFVDFESGQVRDVYNNVQIPGDSGTLFSLTRDLTVDRAIYERYRYTHVDTDGRHELSLLVAPLALDAHGHTTQPLSFNGTTFAADTDVTGWYRFDSYRLTYRMVDKPGAKREFAWGYTLKVRDAAIGVSDGVTTSVSRNTGLVPLLNFRMTWRTSDADTIVFDGDALVGPVGRAEDVQLSYRHRLNDDVTLRAGYRIVEGGVDVPKVYNFTRLDYASVGMEVALK